MTNIGYSVIAPSELDIDSVMRVYVASTLAERRPVDEPGRLRSMLDGSNLIVVARDGDLLVGIARSISDFSYSTYLSDIAVDIAYQKQGIGRELIRVTQLAAPKAKVVLLSAPAAVDYYPRMGFTQHPSAWTLAADVGSA